jgi:hypothetical protein
MLSKKKKALVILYFVGCLYLQVFTPLLLLLLMLDVLDNLIFQIPQQRDNFNNSIFFFCALWSHHVEHNASLNTNLPTIDPWQITQKLKATCALILDKAIIL